MKIFEKVNPLPSIVLNFLRWLINSAIIDKGLFFLKNVIQKKFYRIENSINIVYHKVLTFWLFYIYIFTHLNAKIRSKFKIFSRTANDSQSHLPEFDQVLKQNGRGKGVSFSFRYMPEPTCNLNLLKIFKKVRITISFSVKYVILVYINVKIR